MAEQPGWIIRAPSRCFEFMVAEMQIATLLTKAVMVLEGEVVVLQAAEIPLRQAGQGEAVGLLRRHRAEVEGLAREAQKVHESDFALLHAHALIALWGALETAIEDTVVSVMLNKPSAGRRALSSLGVRTPPAEEDAAFAEIDARRFYRRAEQRSRADGVDVALAASRVLSAFGIQAGVDDERRQVLAEANAVRNVLVHRGGVIDQRAVEEAPSLAPMLGSEIRIGRDELLRYYKAIGAYAQALLEGAVNSSYVPSGSDE